MRPTVTSSSLKIEVTQHPQQSDAEVIDQQITDFNSRAAGGSDFRPLAVFLRDGDTLLGGLVGYTSRQWLHVDVFWLGEAYRGQGYGTALLSAAEQEAIERGCEYAYLDTFDFQAPEFYKKRGYTVFGELPDFPKGHTRFFLKKVLLRSSSY